jgi:acetyl-CoA acyltransferase
MSNPREADACVIVAAKRTPMGKLNGAFKPLRADDLAAIALHATLKQADQRFNLKLLREVLLGCSNQAGEDSRNVARQAALLAGVPVEVPAMTLNRLCGSGLSALMAAWQGIISGQGQAYLVGAVEHMSRSPTVRLEEEHFSSRFGWRFSNPAFKALNYHVEHWEAAERLAATFGFTREQLDAYTLESQHKAMTAWTLGRFSSEIIEASAAEAYWQALYNEETPYSKPLAGWPVQDEGLRARLTLEQLQRLKPLAPMGGVHTAASACPFSDGACALLVCSQSVAQAANLPVLAEVLGGLTVGCHPGQAALSPVAAIHSLLHQHQLSLSQLSAIELHEPFASSALAVFQQLGLNPFADDRLNTWGGALALGAPVAMVSARLVVTLAHRLSTLAPGALGLAALSIGMGQGMAVLLKKPEYS